MAEEDPRQSLSPWTNLRVPKPQLLFLPHQAARAQAEESSLPARGPVHQEHDVPLGLQVPVIAAGTLAGCETHGGDHSKIGDPDPLDQGGTTSLPLS